MKKLNLEVKIEVAVAIANLMDLNVEGLDQPAVIEAINANIDALNAGTVRKSGKWYENETLAFNAGDMADVVTGWAAGRIIQIEKPSAKKNAYKGFLINPKDGSIQATLVTVDEVDIQLYSANKEEKVNEEAEAI